jgi:uncharacterized protein
MNEETRAGIAAFVVAGADTALEPIGRRAEADSGDPQVSQATLYEGPDGSPQVGIWQCTPGGWAIKDRADTEILYVVAGRAVLTGADGTRRDIGPGDTAVLPLHWSGRWQIVETLRKVYVVIPGRSTGLSGSRSS